MPGIVRSWAMSNTGLLIVLAALRLLVHVLTNGQYGWHRDELAVLDDAQFLAWGYVAYPPVTPFIGRIGLESFGVSLVGVRFLAALAQSISMVITGLIARELGGSRRAQVIAAVAVGIAPMSVIMGALFQYISFDYLWWVLIAYLLVRLLKTEDPRWWVAVGAVIGIGMLTKYTLGVLVVGIVVGVLVTPLRTHLRQRWLWVGVLLSLLVFLPNLIWQIQHDFVSLRFLDTIRARDIAIGRTDDFLPMQFVVNANPITVPLWLAGLYFYFFAVEGKRYRTLGWIYVTAFVLFFALQGRFYYLAPAYPMLLAAGAVTAEHWLQTRSTARQRRTLRFTWGGLVLGAAMSAFLMLPLPPVNSMWWQIVAEVHDNFVEQIGWPELVESVATIYDSLPVNERAVTGIVAGNYGEAGAINLYGPALGLPPVISGVNSYWYRGYGDEPQVLIVVGIGATTLSRFFTTCEVAGQVTNRYGVENQETSHPDIFLCRGLSRPWPEVWEEIQSFG